jgi:hypothetical protein
VGAAHVKLLLAAAAVIAAAAAILVVRVAGSDPADEPFERHAPPGAGYAFDIPADYERVEYRKPSPPEGSPASIFRSPRGEFIAATWFGLIALNAPVTRVTLPRAEARVEATVETEQRRQAEQARRRGMTSPATLPAPTRLRIGGLPAQRYFMRRTEITGERTETELYVVYKGKTPFGLGCRRPVDAPDRDGFRALCRGVLASVELGRAPITG